MRVYKPSGIKWLGEIPQSWENVSIRSCFTESNQRCNTDSYPLLSVTIANGIIYQDDIENKKDISNDDKSNYKIVPLNAVAYNKMRMWQGAVGVNTLTIGIVSPAYIVAIPNEKILPNFVSYLFKSKIMISEFDKNSYGLCLDMNNLRYDDFRNIKIPLPPLQEQKEIAEFLDKKCEKIQNYINKKQKLITLLQEKKQALINEVVTKGLNPNIEFKNSGIEYLGLIPHHWEVRRMKFMASIHNGREQTEIADENGIYPIYGSGGILGKSMYFIYDKPSVLLGRKGTIDKPLFVEEPFWTIDTMFYTSVSKIVLPKYFYYLCLTIDFQFYISGSAIPSMTQYDLANISFALPPLQEQKQIANFLDEKCEKINSAIEKTKKQIELVKEYKNTFINEAVCGRIRVN
ncbi:restriction endonuclease subunit S [Campylobacter upsaliensis]|nr:restriction endonuclease subunit S [Campylobacter upsaliensis]EDP6862187.1 restriction endonuclease subunit S [Campylobacter upsaliensis]EDP6883212.1 restriction endonuclease subunit S [Campylobacter upsaliensis]EJN6461837.1 restriction endonuclease subunit S [Campylobacter upsaliensis]